MAAFRASIKWCCACGPWTACPSKSLTCSIATCRRAPNSGPVRFHLICSKLRMTKELPEIDFQRFWRKLQQLGLNAYEARSYLVLVGHPRFKALELAARSHVPRHKSYEVLDSLVEKGFAQVIQEKTKLFSAVEPGLAIPSYLERRAQGLQQDLLDQT